MRSKRRTKIISEINVTPFVDVVLVLLIIFMITAPLLSSSIEVNLPQVSKVQTHSKPEAISITLNSKGEIFLENQKVKITTLEKKLKSIIKANSSTNIYIRGDKNVRYGLMVELMDHINMAGFTNVALSTDINDHE